MKKKEINAKDKEKKGIYAVIVTYANRYHLVKKVIEGALKEGVEKVIVVDNNSHPKSKKQISNLDSLFPKKVEVISLNENTGSAGGYKTGLMSAVSKERCNYIWLLDDDNVPEKGALSELLKYKELYYKKNKNENLVLMSMRHYDVSFNYKTKKELLLKNLEDDIMIINSFCYFSLIKLFYMMKSFSQKKQKRNNLPIFQTVAGGYGGLFLPKKVVEKVGFPREELFTYFDDIEYTYRMYQKYKINLFLVVNSKIKDIDMTLQNQNIKTYFPLFKILSNIYHMNKNKLYYGYRNRVILEKEYLVKNKPLYLFNKYCFLLIIFPLVFVVYSLIYRNTDNIKLLGKAVKDGLKW